MKILTGNWESKKFTPKVRWRTKGDEFMKSLAIEREYGTGGWELGKRIAKIKGIPFYDEQGIIIEAEKMGYKLGLLKNYEEKKKESILYNIAAIANYEAELKIEVEKMIREMFQELKETVEMLYGREPAVFVGGAVCGILDKTDDFIKVFLHSSRSDTKSAYLNQHKGDFSNVEINRLMENKDKQRGIYFRMLTHKEWKNVENYDFTYDVSKITKETIVNAVCEKMDK